MDENPYRCPMAGPKRPQRRYSGRLRSFLRLPNTWVEWMVIAGVVATVVALMLPDFNDGVSRARRKTDQQGSPLEPDQDELSAAVMTASLCHDHRSESPVSIRTAPPTKPRTYMNSFADNFT